MVPKHQPHNASSVIFDLVFRNVDIVHFSFHFIHSTLIAVILICWNHNLG